MQKQSNYNPSLIIFSLEIKTCYINKLLIYFINKTIYYIMSQLNLPFIYDRYIMSPLNLQIIYDRYITDIGYNKSIDYGAIQNIIRDSNQQISSNKEIAPYYASLSTYNAGSVFFSEPVIQDEFIRGVYHLKGINYTDSEDLKSKESLTKELVITYYTKILEHTCNKIHQYNDRIMKEAYLKKPDDPAEYIKNSPSICLCLSTVPGELFKGYLTGDWLKEAVEKFIKTELYTKNPFRINIDCDADDTIRYMVADINYIEFIKYNDKNKSTDFTHTEYFNRTCNKNHIFYVVNGANTELISGMGGTNRFLTTYGEQRYNDPDYFFTDFTLVYDSNDFAESTPQPPCNQPCHCKQLQITDYELREMVLKYIHIDRKVHKFTQNNTFRERQESAGCGRHALNNLLKDTVFTVGDRNIPFTFDPNNIIYPIPLQSICNTWSRLLTPGSDISLTCSAAEYYDFEVLKIGLNQMGYQTLKLDEDRLHGMHGPDFRLDDNRIFQVYPIQNDLKIVGFIGYLVANIGGGHWECIRKRDNGYEWVNSIDKQRDSYDDSFKDKYVRSGILRFESFDMLYKACMTFYQNNRDNPNNLFQFIPVYKAASYEPYIGFDTLNESVNNKGDERDRIINIIDGLKFQYDLQKQILLFVCDQMVDSRQTCVTQSRDDIKTYYSNILIHNTIVVPSENDGLSGSKIALNTFILGILRLFLKDPFDLGSIKGGSVDKSQLDPLLDTYLNVVFCQNEETKKNQQDAWNAILNPLIS